MRYETLIIDVLDRVALVTINRPEVRNALSRVVERLAQALHYTTEDKTEGAAAFLDKRTSTFRGK